MWLDLRYQIFDCGRLKRLHGLLLKKYRSSLLQCILSVTVSFKSYLVLALSTRQPSALILKPVSIPALWLRFSTMELDNILNVQSNLTYNAGWIIHCWFVARRELGHPTGHLFAFFHLLPVAFGLLCWRQLF